MSTRTTEFAAAITGDASSAIAALEKVKVRVQDTAKAAESANEKTAKSFELTVDKARKAAAGVTGLSQALFALEAEGSTRVLALGAAVGNFAELFGPAGALVTGVGVAGSAIVALFLQAKEKAAEATKAIEEDIARLVNAGDFATLTKKLQEIEQGTAGAGFADGRAAARARIEQLSEEVLLAGKSNRFYLERQKAITEEKRKLAELTKEYDRYFKALTDPRNAPSAPRGLAGQPFVVTANRTERSPARSAPSAPGIDDSLRKLRELEAEREKARRADEAIAKNVADTIASLTLDLAGLQAEASGSAVRTLDAVYARITAELEKKAAASAEAATQAERLGEAESAEKLRALTAGFREQVQIAERRRDGLKEITRLSERAAAAQQIEARFTKAANASYAESVPTIADVKRAESDLLRVRTALQAIANDPATDPAVRAEAQKQLAALVLNEAGATAILAQNTGAAATAAQNLGAGIQSSAQAALSLVQLLGDGNTELAQMLSSVVSIGSGIGGLGAAASAAGGFGALFSSAGGIASALGPIGAIAGGVVSLVGVLGQQSAAAKQRAEELSRAAEEFTANLAKFVKGISEQDLGAFAQAREALAKEIGSLLADAVKRAGFNDAAFRNATASAASLRAYREAILGQIDWLQKSGQVVPPALFRLAGAIAELLPAAEAGEADLRRRQEDEIKAASKSLEVRALIAQGRSEEGAALREQLDAQEELNEAIENFAGAEGYQEYIRALKAVQAAEAAAAAATRARTRAINELNDTNDILGGTAGQKLSRALGTFGTLFSQIGDAAKGLDLSTKGGLETFRANLRRLFMDLLKDGISEAEQPIVDAIKTIFPNIDAALDAIADPFQQSVEAFGELVRSLGLSLAEQINGFATRYGQQFGVIAQILGTGFDVTKLSGAQRTSLRESIGAQITEILKDGVISDEERPLLGALQVIFGLLGDLIDEAKAEAESLAADAESKRQRRLSLGASEANLDNALSDATGADAFFTSLGAFSTQFREALGTIDVSSAAGIAAATGKLKSFYDSIEGLTDEQLVERFGMTRDEIIAALTQIDGGLDGLGEALQTLATQQTDFLTQVNLAYFDAFGQGLEAVKLQTEIWVEQMIATATALNLLTPDLERRIRAIGARRIDNAAAQAAEREARPTGTAAATPTATATQRSNTTVVGDFGGLSEITAQSLAGLLREIAINTSARGAVVEAILGRGAPPSLASLRFPAFPTGGSVSAGTIVNIGPITVHVGGIAADGATPAAAGSMVAREIAAQLGRLATQEVRFLGSGVA